jgi:hypothetical protein
MAAQGISGSCTRGQLIYQADCWRNIAISLIDQWSNRAMAWSILGDCSG